MRRVTYELTDARILLTHTGLHFTEVVIHKTAQC